MVRLRTVHPDQPGWRRVRRGRGFAYLDGDRPLSISERERCVSLAIPPAWTEVWICPAPNGHIQAVGTDEAGRRQYLYHPAWREQRDQEKFDYMLEFAARLPTARRTVRRHLDAEEWTLQRVSALGFRMLDTGCFRIGGERYAEDNGSHGLVTLDRTHVRLADEGIRFRYLAKSGQERELVVCDPILLTFLPGLANRPGPPDRRLLAYRDAESWHDLHTDHLNAYLKERLGDEASAKHFRTWQANVVAAADLAMRPAKSATARKREVAATMRVVAEFLGNTPAVARSGYVDPRLVDLYHEGSVLDPRLAARFAPVLGRALSPRLERAVLELLG